MPFAKLGEFSVIISLNIFQLYSFSPVFWDFDNMNVRSFAVVLTGPWGSVHCLFVFFFQSIFFLLSILGNFYCYILKFINSFIWPLHSAVLNFSYCTFSLKFQFVSSLYLLFFLPRLYIFSFVSNTFMIARWSIFMMVALKSLSDHSKICVIYVLASVDGFSLWRLVFSYFSTFLI